MASTSKNWTGTNTWVSCRLVVSAKASVDGNFSTVTATLYGARNDGGTSYNASGSSFWININGAKTSRTSGCTVSGSGWTQVHAQTTKVQHNDDGNKTITISAGGGINETSFQMGSTSLTLKLDKIARKSSLAIESGTLGIEQVITITRQGAGFVDTITYVCGTEAGTICEKTTETEVVYTPSMSLASQNTTGTSLQMDITVETFDGESSVGATTYKIPYLIPEQVKPDASVLTEDAAGCLDVAGKYVQGNSRLQVDIAAAGMYGAGIESYKTVVDGKTYTTASFVTDPLVGAGELNLATTVIDTRGRSIEITKTIEVCAYAKPKVMNLAVKRCDEAGIATASGAFLALSFDAAIAELDGKNTATYVLMYKKTTGTAYSQQTLSDYEGVYTVMNGSAIIPADPSSSYEIIVVASDAFGSTQKSGTGGTARKVFSLLQSGLGLAFGKIAEYEDVLEIAYRIKHTGGFSYPVLDAEDLNDVTRPNMYLLPADHTYAHMPEEGDTMLEVQGKEGSLLRQKLTSLATNSRWERVWSINGWSKWLSELDKLHPVGSYYIANNADSPAELFGGTWERVEGCFLWGCLESEEIGAVGGESEHVLTVDEMPKHRHTVQCTKDEASGYGIGSSGGFTNRVLVTGASAKSTGATYYSGNDTAHNNMPPYINAVIWRRTA